MAEAASAFSSPKRGDKCQLGEEEREGERERGRERGREEEREKERDRERERERARERKINKKLCVFVNFSLIYSYLPIGQ
jgi:hypothetical protein